MIRVAKVSINFPRLYSIVSFFCTHGRSTAMLTIVGSPASTTTFARGASFTGRPKSATGTAEPIGFQSAKYVLISASNVAGSASPEITTSVLSGRYQRSRNAFSEVAVAPFSVATVPIGDPLPSACPAKNSSRVASPTFCCGLVPSRSSASTVRRSVSTAACVTNAPDIMPDNILTVSSRPSGVALGKSSL